MWISTVYILFCVINLFAINYAKTQVVMNSSDILTHRKCFVVAESSVYSMLNKASDKNCVGFVCWESHLTVVSKAKITLMYNRFRNQVADIEKSSLFMKMNWHWTLENEALRIIESCPAEKLHVYEFQRNIDGLDNALTCEYSVAKFHLTNPSQQDFLDVLPRFLNSNLTHDFDNDGKFRRSNVLHFGCALTITNSSNGANYFVCVYCSKDKSVSYTDNCSKYTESKGVVSEFPYLCRVPKYIDLYGCEPKKLCESSQPEIWTKSVPGDLEQFYVVIGQEIRLFINRTIYETNNSISMGSENNSLIFTKPSSSWLFNYAPLSEYCCIYDEETVQLLAASSNSLSETDKKRVKRAAEQPTKVLKYSHIEPQGDYYPVCCIYLLILNLILFIALLVLVRFTYVHYKSSKSVASEPPKSPESESLKSKSPKSSTKKT